MVAMYEPSIGRLARAAFFWPFPIQRINSSMPGYSPHHIGMARQMSMASVLLRLSQLYARWLIRAFANTLLNYVSASSRSLTHVSSAAERTNRRADRLSVETRRNRAFLASKTTSCWLLYPISGFLGMYRL